MELHQNGSKTAESTKEAKAICACTVQEAKTACSRAVREAETQGASQAESLHRQHAKMIKLLQEQVSQEECQSQADFLSTCQATLNASPMELRGALVASYHILMGHAPTFYLFTLSQGASPAEQPSAPSAPPSPAPEHSPRPKKQQKGLLAPNSKRFHLGIRHSSTSLVKEARKEYFKRHSHNFTTEGTHDLSEVFRHMAKSTKLLGSSIYEIQEVCKGPDKL